jgi:osmotically inducible protein OsmC
MDKVGEGFKIISVNLSVEAEVPGIGDQEFQALAEKAKATCPVSQALAGTKITLRAKKVG